MERKRITKKAFEAMLMKKYDGKVEVAKRTVVDHETHQATILYLYYHTEWGHCGTWQKGGAVEFDCEADKRPDEKTHHTSLFGAGTERLCSLNKGEQHDCARTY